MIFLIILNLILTICMLILSTMHIELYNKYTDLLIELEKGDEDYDF